MSGNGPRRIASVLSQLMARRGYAQVQAAIDLQAEFAAAVGTQLAQHARPGAFRNGILEIIVADSTTMQELMFVRKKVLERLKTSLPQAGVKDLKYRLGKID